MSTLATNKPFHVLRLSHSAPGGGGSTLHSCFFVSHFLLLIPIPVDHMYHIVEYLYIPLDISFVLIAKYHGDSDPMFPSTSCLIFATNMAEVDDFSAIRVFNDEERYLVSTRK